MAVVATLQNDAAPQILTPSQRVQLLAFPDDEGELIRRYTLTKADLAFVRQHRGDHNRLGIAAQMRSLCFPGRVVLGENERPHDRLLNLVATQLGIPIVASDLYAQRDATRREHLLKLVTNGGVPALRFLYKITLREDWCLEEVIPTPKNALLAFCRSRTARLVSEPRPHKLRPSQR